MIALWREVRGSDPVDGEGLNRTCDDCGRPMKICSIRTIMEKSFPPGWITVVLINRDQGL